MKQFLPAANRIKRVTLVFVLVLIRTFQTPNFYSSRRPPSLFHNRRNEMQRHGTTIELGPYWPTNKFIRTLPKSSQKARPIRGLKGIMLSDIERARNEIVNICRS